MAEATVPTTLPEWLVRRLELARQLSVGQTPNVHVGVQFRHGHVVGTKTEIDEGPPGLTSGRGITSHG